MGHFSGTHNASLSEDKALAVVVLKVPETPHQTRDSPQPQRRRLRPLRYPESPCNRFGGIIGARRRPGKRSLPDRAQGFGGNLVTGGVNLRSLEHHKRTENELGEALHLMSSGVRILGVR